MRALESCCRSRTATSGSGFHCATTWNSRRWKRNWKRHRYAPRSRWATSSRASDLPTLFHCPQTRPPTSGTPMMTRPRTAIFRGGIALSCALAACRPTPTTTAPAPAPAAPTAQAQRPPMFVSPTSLAGHRIVPVPLSVTPGSGAAFTLTSSTIVQVPAGNADVARTGEMLAMLLRVPTGLPYPVTASNGAAPRGAIVLRLGGPASLGDEGYELHDLRRLGAHRRRATPAGLFRGDADAATAAARRRSRRSRASDAHGRARGPCPRDASPTGRASRGAARCSTSRGTSSPSTR